MIKSHNSGNITWEPDWIHGKIVLPHNCFDNSGKFTKMILMMIFYSFCMKSLFIRTTVIRQYDSWERKLINYEIRFFESAFEPQVSLKRHDQLWFSA